ncbi:ABC transporter ATP-binding protein, partial [Candidatus Saccharibacteria bacterium]|nr:ABC transporter ATP-binding protein [Candidatus Saccharibacteria bacterium]
MLKSLKFLKPYWWQVLLLFVAIGLQVFMNLQLPAQMADLINHGITTGDTSYIWLVGAKMLGFALGSAVAAFLSTYLSARVGANFARDMRAAVFKKVLTLNPADVKEISTASLINRTTNDVNQVQQTIIMMLSMMLIAPMSCVISLVMAITTAPDMSWIIAIGAVAILSVIAIIMSLVVPKFKIFQILVDKVTMLTRENLTGLKVIRAFNNENLERAKFAETNEELTRLNIFVDKLMKLTNPLINVIFNGLTLLCTYIGISLLTQNFDYLGDMSAFTQYVTQLMISFLMLSMLFVMLPRANVSAGRINEVLDMESKVTWRAETLGIPDKIASIEFKNVDFRYDKAAEKVL